MPNEDLKQNVVIAEIKKDVCYIKESLQHLHKKMEKSDRKFAMKWVEKVMIGMIGLILASVIGGLMSMIIQ